MRWKGRSSILPAGTNLITKPRKPNKMNKTINIKNLRAGDLFTPLNRIRDGKEFKERPMFGGTVFKVKSVAFPYIYVDHPVGFYDLRDATIMRVSKKAL